MTLILSQIDSDLGTRGCPQGCSVEPSSMPVLVCYVHCEKIHPKVGGFKQQKMTFSQFWKPSMKSASLCQNQGIGTAPPSLKTVGENLVSSDCLIPWSVVTSIYSLPPWSHSLLHLCQISLCLTLIKKTKQKTLVILFILLPDYSG